MIGHSITIDDKSAREAMAIKPQAVARHVDANLGVGANEVAREMVAILGENKSMLTSQLALSILNGVKHVAPMHWRVQSGTNYGRMVDEGTGPAAGRQRYAPDVRSLMAYVKQRAGIAWAGRPGSRKRRSQEREVRDRAWGLALYIAQHGTKPHPIAKPALERKRSRLYELVRAGAAAGLAESSGGKA